MNYAAEEYENPPAPVAPAMETNTLGGEMFEDARDRPDLPKKQPMSIKEAIMAAHAPKDRVTVASAAHLMNMITYGIFLVVVIYICFCKNSSETYYYNSILKTTFTRCPRRDGTDLVDVNVIDDVWDFLNATVMEGLYWQETNNALAAQGMILFENKLLGNPTLRMLKVRNDTCTVVDAFKREIKECFGAYTESNEDQETIGDTGAQFVYSSSKKLGTASIYGKLAIYGGGGFNVEFPISGVEIARISLQQLSNIRFIDRGTRAIIFDFAMFNGNVNLFCVIQILFELPPMGGVIAKATITPLDLIRYGDGWGSWIIAFEGLFVGILIFFIVEELIEILRCRLRYFQSFWNLVDVVLLSVGVVCVILSRNMTSVATKRLNIVLSGVSTTAQMDDAVAAASAYSNWCAVLLFIAFMKVFKFISVNKTMSQLSATLTRSAKDIGGFAVMFCVFFFAYAQFGYLIFGNQIEDYSSFVSSMLALLRTILGDFDYLALQNANRILGPVFFVSFVFFVFFVLLNMFLAIINDSYVEVKRELAKKRGEMTLMDWVRQKINIIMHKRYGSRPDPPDDPMITYEEYKGELIKVGYKEQDIIEAFTKVDVKGDDVVTDTGMILVSEETSKLLNRKRELKEECEQYTRIRRRVDALEAALNESSRSLDTILCHLVEHDEQKHAKRELEMRMQTKKNLDDLDEYQASVLKKTL